MKFTKKSIYIGLFTILYLIVAFSSFFHACSFFGLANNAWMSIILAFAFEVGQAAVLFSLLTSSKDRSRIMPWVLMFMFTLVQVIGNVFSSYKYIVTNSVDDLRYFKEPIFIWTSIPDDQATVIIVYLVGALLPIAALLLTSMVTNYLSDQEQEKIESIKDAKELPEKVDNIDKDEEITKLKEQLKQLENDKAEEKILPSGNSGSEYQDEQKSTDDEQPAIKEDKNVPEDIEEYKQVIESDENREPEPKQESKTEQIETEQIPEVVEETKKDDEPELEFEETTSKEKSEEDEFKNMTQEEIEEIKRRRASRFVNLTK